MIFAPSGVLSTRSPSGPLLLATLSAMGREKRDRLAVCAVTAATRAVKVKANPGVADCLHALKQNARSDGAEVAGWITIPAGELATTVSKMLNSLFPVGTAAIAMLVNPRTTQFWILSSWPLLNSTPSNPTPPPVSVRPTRLTTSLGQALIVTALIPAVTVTPASPTPSLMMLSALVIVTAP